ncbi:hypothetical protein ACWC24_36340 [Streptomyces sp. NPDC001443]
MSTIRRPLATGPQPSHPAPEAAIPRPGTAAEQAALQAPPVAPEHHHQAPLGRRRQLGPGPGPTNY